MYILNKINTYKEETRTNKSTGWEHVTPVHEFCGGKQGSPFQSAGGLFKLLSKSSIAATAKCF